MTAEALDNWPALRTYADRELAKVMMPVGGIGTGAIGFGGRGQLDDFEIMNRPAKGERPGAAFFAIRVARHGSDPVVRVLEGPLPDSTYGGQSGSTAPNHGLPRFEDARFESAYPFARVRLVDALMPTVTVGAFNPMIPGDVPSSSWPVLTYRVAVENTNTEPIEVSVASVIENFIGGPASAYARANERLTAAAVEGVRLGASGLPAGDRKSGDFVVAIVRDAGITVSSSARWADSVWGNALLSFWDGFSATGSAPADGGEGGHPVSTVVGSATVGPGETATLTFLLAWNFPNREAWSGREGFEEFVYSDSIIGNHYSTVHPDPWQTVVDFAAALPELESRTIEAVETIIGSTLPGAILEAALLNLSTLRTETVFRAADGRFFAWEGVTDNLGSCYGTCTHVWGYEFATCYLFPEIARSFRATQYGAATGDKGHMVFRVGIGGEPRAFGIAAADGQMATLVHLYLDWKLSGDHEQLTALWPAARRTLEFAWIEGGWDPDRSGVMTGCQHNTMDVEYYGPNPQMGTWYLAALRAAEELARVMGDEDFAAGCREVFERGSAWIDANLFVGSHYRQIVVPPVGGAQSIAAGLRHPDMGARSLDAPDFQVGEGVLVDQLVGQYASRLVGLGDVVDRDHVRKTLGTIFSRNRRSDFHAHFNPTRSFVGAGETGLVMCAYEGVERPSIPFPYFAEVMTGFEYTAATGMILDGDPADGLAVIEAIRSRYTGVRRNPFDEAECGHHYARALASWSAFVAWTGFEYDAPTATISFRLPETTGSTFWSTGYAWGTFTQTAESTGTTRGDLEVLWGTLALRSVRIGDALLELDGDEPRTRGDRIVVTL